MVLTALPVARSRSSTRGRLVIAGLVLAVLAGLWANRLGHHSLLALGLVLPLVVAGRAMVRRPLGGVALFSFAASTLMLFAARLFTATPDAGLLSRVSMPLEEFRSARLLGNALLSLFGLGAALGMVGFLTRVETEVPEADEEPPRQPATGRKSEFWFALGVTVVGVAGGLMGTGGAVGLELEPTSRPGQLLWQLATPVPGVLLQRGKKLLALVLLVPIGFVPVITGRRQGLLTPLAFLAFAWMASAIPPKTRLKPSMLIRAGALVAVLLMAVATMSALRRAETLGSIYPGERVTALSVLAKDQVSSDLFYLAVAREPRPAPVDIFGRIVALPIPRALWPGKPLSYDHEFRERYFPEFGGSMPITVVGTAYVGLLAPGVMLAGLLVGRLARKAAILLERRSARSVLTSAAILMLALDLVRVGGLYRELLTFALSVVAVRLLVRDRS